MLNSVHGGHAGNGGAVFGSSGDDGGDEFRIHERPHRVVHQNNVIGRGLDAGQRVGHRLLAMVAALDHAHWLFESFFFQARLELLDLFFAQRQDDLAHLRRSGKFAQRVNDYGNAAQLGKLLGGRRLAALGSGGGHTRPQPGRGDDDGDLHKLGERV